MSATVDADRFSAYLRNAPVLNIPGRTYPVETKFLEDAIEITRFQHGGNLKSDRPTYDISDDEGETVSDPNLGVADLTGYSANTREVLRRHNEYKIDYDLVVRLLEVIASEAHYAQYSKAVLVFLPGLAEIRRLNDILNSNQVFARKWMIHSLHSAIATEDQEKAFVVPPAGVRKVVIATNIAETGITIPDVTCVIDTGKHREIRSV